MINKSRAHWNSKYMEKITHKENIWSKTHRSEINIEKNHHTVEDFSISLSVIYRTNRFLKILKETTKSLSKSLQKT